MSELATSPSQVASATAEINVEPVTRTAGGIGLRVAASADGRRYTGSRCAVRMFRGYEQILVGRDLRDAIYLSSRCCGYHGGQHAIASAQAVEMALELAPPPMAIALRNLGLAAETIHAEAAHLFLLAGPDLSEQAVRRHWPDVWSAAERAPAPHAEVHGVATIGEIMASLNPGVGRWYKDAFSVARIPLQMYAILHGKYPHPQTLVPGGVATQVADTTTSKVHDYVVRLLALVDPAKRVATMIDDLLDFLVATVPALAEVGAGRANFIDGGQWDDPDDYDPSWPGLSARGDRRWGAPGVVIDGKLRTSDLRDVVEGVEESVEQSFYEAWNGDAGLFARHNVAARAAQSSGAGYTFCTKVQWRGEMVETGPGARLFTTALRGHFPSNPFLAAGDGALYLNLPEGALPELVLEWRPPQVWNAIERTRARLYGVVFAALVAANQAFKVLDLQKQSRHQVSTPFDAWAKAGGRGVGLAGDGFLGHWLTAERGMIANYQVIAPSTINLGPGGAAEQAIDGSPLIPSPAAGLGIEAQIALRSFDPCGNCASH
ncbi:MAG: nickel-dependent hydrogenase large subunit [Candidatus Dormibacteria bacterium]